MAVASALLVPAALALACTPQAYMVLDQSSYRPGERMVIRGAHFVRRTKIAIRVQPRGATGETMTSARGTFRTSLVAPRRPGRYLLYAARADRRHEPGLPTRTAFGVRSSRTSSSSGIEISSRPRRAGAGGLPAEATIAASRALVRMLLPDRRR